MECFSPRDFGLSSDTGSPLHSWQTGLDSNQQPAGSKPAALVQLSYPPTVLCYFSSGSGSFLSSSLRSSTIFIACSRVRP